MWSNILTTAEVEYTEKAIAALKGVNWAKSVLHRLNRAGGLKPENKPLMFEVRFAYELHLMGKTAEYEYNAGIGNSSIDFRIPSTITWLIELVSVRTSEAAKKATVQTDTTFIQILSSNAEDKKQTPGAEMIKAEEKIANKVFENGEAIKFPLPAANVWSEP